MTHRLAIAGALLGILLPAAVSAAAPVVANPAPDGPAVTADLAEAWRAGGEDDEIFFGSVPAIRTDPAGNVYLLDGQMSVVQVYAPDGTHLRTLFREGEGPGEIRRPGDMFLGPDGAVCALQSFPGRIVEVDAGGQPARVVTYSHGPAAQGQMAFLNRGFALPGGLLLAGIRMNFTGGVNQQTYFLALCGQDGVEKTALLEKESPVDYADFVMTERGLDFVWSRVAVARDGTIFMAPDRDAYAIEVHGPDGALLRTITREYTPGERDADETRTARRVLEAVAAYYPSPPRAYETEDTSPAVAGLWATDDGRLWVQTGNAHKDTPGGTWVVLDVFAPDGKLERRVALPGRHHARRDALSVQPDGRIFVIVGALDAFLSQQAVAKDEAEESTPLEVICYDMES